jgi:hypothetical protein
MHALFGWILRADSRNTTCFERELQWLTRLCCAARIEEERKRVLEIFESRRSHLICAKIINDYDTARRIRIIISAPWSVSLLSAILYKQKSTSCCYLLLHSTVIIMMSRYAFSKLMRRQGLMKIRRCGAAYTTILRDAIIARPPSSRVETPTRVHRPEGRSNVNNTNRGHDDWWATGDTKNELGLNKKCISCIFYLRNSTSLFSSI